MNRPQNPERGFLASVGVTPQILVEFQYNPTQLSDKRSVNYATLGAPGLVMPRRQYTQGGDRSFNFTVRVDGLIPGPSDDTIDLARAEDGSIGPELNKYRAFLYPRSDRWREAAGSFAGLYEEADAFVSPPACRFGFGLGDGSQPRVIDAVVTEVSITELLFNRNLAPMRADVAVSLVELSPYGDEGVAGAG